MLNQNFLYKLLSSNSKAYKDLTIDENFNKAINLLNKNSIVLDFGANIGNVSNYILEKKEPKIFAFEPNKLCFEVMVRRFLDDSRVKIFNVAVSNFTGLSKFYLHEKSVGIKDFDYIESSSLKSSKDNVSKKNNIEINVVNISEILSKFDMIDLIKIDVEGSEYEIVPYLITQKHKIKKVLCEFHGNPDKFNYQNPSIPKNKELSFDYTNLITNLKSKNLYNNWLYEWH